MLLSRVLSPDGAVALWLVEGDRAVNLTAADPTTFASIADWLRHPDPVGAAQRALAAVEVDLSPQPPPRSGEGESPDPGPIHSPSPFRGGGWGERLTNPGAGKGERSIAVPIDRQEVWAAGVTYLRSKEARMEESEGGGSFYDRVYVAERPELFLKATPSRVVGPEEPIRIREDAAWNVPEPEVALVVTPSLRIVGYTIGNDVSSRDIEGENPLYLPQAKVYRQSCALGPAILLEEEMRGHRNFGVTLTIERGGRPVFRGETSTSQMKRRFDELVAYLGRENLFPDGVFLLTGTGIVPPDDFTLEPGDQVAIEVPEIGTLRNHVVRGGNW